MKKIIQAALLMLSFNNIYGQQFTVNDKVTGKTLASVLIYSPDHKISVTSDYKGKANADLFRNSDTIYFRLTGYHPLTLSYPETEKLNFIVMLEPKHILLDEVTVSAHRQVESRSETPNTIKLISIKEISLQNPQTSADLLGLSGYVYIQKSQLGGGSPMLRGFATNRVLLVVDGVRMNNAIFRSGNLQNVISIDALSVESAEILFGPGSVIYGSDAIGGVMDFHTLSPAYSDSIGKVNISGNALARYSTAANEKSGHFHLKAGWKKIALVSSFTYSDFDDFKAGSNGNSYFLRPFYQQTVNGIDTILTNGDPQVQVASGYSQKSTLQKFYWKISDSFEAGYSFQYSETSDIPRYDRLYADNDEDGILDYAKWYYGPQKWIMNRLELDHRYKNAIYDEVKVILAFQNYSESRNDRRFENKRLRNQTETVNAISVNTDFNKRFSERASLFYGLEYVHNSVGSKAKRTNIETGEVTATNTRYPDGSEWSSAGIYTTVKFKPASAITITAGARYTHYSLQAEFDTSLFPYPFTETSNSNGAVNGSIGVIYNPVASCILYMNASTGFRAPNIDDIGKVFDSEAGSVVIPNESLKPEYAYNLEMGVAKSFNRRLKVDAAVYYTLLEDALVRRNYKYFGADSIIYEGELSQVQAIQNISKAYVYGIQAGIDITILNELHLTSNISYQKGEEQSEDSLIYYPKSHVAPLFGSTHLVYEHKKITADLYGEYNAKMDYDELPLTERNDNAPYAKNSNGLPYVPGWYTLNIKGSFQVNKFFNVTAGVENLTDQLYRPYASGISAAGRNFIIASKFIF
jgi:hemoglobin/transferrin/lactoferrin receptor protein